MDRVASTVEPQQLLPSRSTGSQRKGGHVRYFFVLFLVWYVFTFSVAAMEAGTQPKETEKIIGIESSSFFHALKRDYKEVFYVYFGRPTCLECIEFEEELETFLETSNWVVYYYNTEYWKDDPQHTNILSEYHVDSVPALVKISFGEYESSFTYDPSVASSEVQAQLNQFFPPLPVGILSVTDKSYPIQFHDRLSAFVFLLLAANALYLFFAKKELVQKKPKFMLLFIFITSSILAWLQTYIFSLGFSFTMAYEASPANDFLSQLGGIGLMISGPLYIAICFLCIYIKGAQLSTKKDADISAKQPDGTA